MARHKHPTQSLSDVAQTIAMEKPLRLPSPAIAEKSPNTLAERVAHAEKMLAEAKGVANACYWQGALDALNAFSRGAEMPSVIGDGVKS